MGLLNEIKYPEIIDSTKQAVEMFNKEIYKILPESDYNIESSYTEHRGSEIYVYFVNVNKNDHSFNRGNSSIDVTFMVKLAFEREQTDPEFDKDSFEVKIYQRRFPSPLKFRTITGKTPMEAMTKLLEWFKKNRDVIDSIPKFREKPLGQM